MRNVVLRTGLLVASRILSLRDHVLAIIPITRVIILISTIIHLDAFEVKHELTRRLVITMIHLVTNTNMKISISSMTFIDLAGLYCVILESRF